MNPGEGVVAIVFLIVAGIVFSKWINAISHRKNNRDSRLAQSEEADELRDQILTLEDRIQVLERIITESSSRDDLRRQFRDLER